MRKMLLSFRPEVYEKIKAGQKIFEHRRNFPDESVMAYMYVSSPVKVIDQDCWEKIIYFARKHNWMNETNDKWNIFHVMTKYKICIIPSISGKTDRKIAAIITVESIDGFSQKLNLYWELDSKYKNSEFLMPELSKGLEEKSIWKADYVLRWMDNELINAANEFYERDNLKNKKLFNQLIKIVGARLKEYFK